MVFLNDADDLLSFIGADWWFPATWLQYPGLVPATSLHLS